MPHPSIYHHSTGAIEVYSQALVLRPDDAPVLSNRCAALLSAELPFEAAVDARRSIEVGVRGDGEDLGHL